jgi:hypothetical protein
MRPSDGHIVTDREHDNQLKRGGNRKVLEVQACHKWPHCHKMSHDTTVSLGPEVTPSSAPKRMKTWSAIDVASAAAAEFQK